MDMDIPDPNELQWLEEEYLLEEEESGTEHPPYSFPDQDEEPSSEVQQPQPQTLPDSEHSFSSASPDNDDGSKKRLRSQFDTSANGKLFGGDKRSRVVAEAEVGNWDDDWQRQDKCLSWYASEIDGDCIPITGPRGERVYAKIEKHSSTDVRTFAMPLHAHSSGLISVPVSTLLQRAEQDAFLKALQASSEVENDLLRPEASVATEELWVNKYAPKCFTELLSDEQTNREVLLWLKQWDSTVFGVDIKNTADEVLDALRRHSSASHHQKHFNTSFIRRNKGSISTEKYFGRSTVLDEENIRSKGIHGLQNKKLRVTGPPEQKVLLLCGPPGLGKTTLAHVAAKRCGYHVVEINASDDRSSATIEPKILDAVQMNSVMADSKPKCLIIDEIDGALGEGKGAVEVILKMVAMDRGKEGSAKEDQLGMKSVKRGRKALPLLRPVICICNDIYAPPLRPLRQVAKVHVFGQPTVSRVVSRLKYICNKEGLMTSCTVLTALAEHTECDIRSCLNTLQFLHKKKEGLNLPAISSHSVGRKDMTRSIFDIWKEVFQTRKMKRSKKSDMSEIVINDAPDSLYSLINNRGDYELICDGIHENILRLHYHDPLMQKTVDCLDAIGISDLFHHHVMSSHNMSLYAYHATAIINVRVLLGQVERPIIEWPKSFMRYRTLLMENLEILRSWHSKITPCISRHLSVKSFVQDTVSSLLHILSPPTLRPVALHLLTEKEKNDLDQVVSTMISCSITYKNMKSIPLSNMGCEGMMDPLPLSLDPPLQQFTGFKGYKSGYHELPSAVKQILVHEVEKQKILLGSKARSMLSKDSWTEEGIASGTEQNGMLESAMMHSTATRAGYNAERSRNRSNMSVSDPSISKNPLSLESGGGSAAVAKSRTPGETKKPSIGTVSFFDRFKRLGGKFPANVDSPIQKPVTLERDSRLVLFKYNEGFTNAVKRPVRVRDIIA